MEKYYDYVIEFTGAIKEFFIRENDHGCGIDRICLYVNDAQVNTEYINKYERIKNDQNGRLYVIENPMKLILKTSYKIRVYGEDNVSHVFFY